MNSYYRCRVCNLESSVRRPKSYIPALIAERLRKMGWNVVEHGWRVEVKCPDCAKAAE